MAGKIGCTYDELILSSTEIQIIFSPRLDLFRLLTFPLLSYTNEDGSLKGDGRCCYLKPESVDLAITLLDQSEIVPGHKVTVKRADFTAVAGKVRRPSPPC